MTLLEDFIMSTNCETPKLKGKLGDDQWLYEKLKQHRGERVNDRDFFNMWTTPKDPIVKLPSRDGN